MFVNRFIKALAADRHTLSTGKKPKGDKLGPFIFPSANVHDPSIVFRGQKIPAAVYFFGCLTLANFHKTADYKPEYEPQFFDFGFIDNETIKREAPTVAEGYEVGLIDLPALCCWMEHSWIDVDNLPVHSGYLYMKDGEGIIGAEVRNLSAEVLLTSASRETYVNVPAQFVRCKEYFVWNGQILHLPAKACAQGYDCLPMVNTSNAEVAPSNIFDPLMSMLGRLNADGIEREYVPAPAKLNRRRARKGIPGVVAHTKVKIRPPRAVLGHSGPRLGDDYTPKRYHFRRGHVRHFQNGQKTWVRPCFVGDPADGIVKHVYEVGGD
jgi:hypothetical protein